MPGRFRRRFVVFVSAPVFAYCRLLVRSINAGVNTTEQAIENKEYTPFDYVLYDIYLNTGPTSRPPALPARDLIARRRANRVLTAIMAATPSSRWSLCGRDSAAHLRQGMAAAVDGVHIVRTHPAHLHRDCSELTPRRPSADWNRLTLSAANQTFMYVGLYARRYVCRYVGLYVCMHEGTSVGM